MERGTEAELAAVTREWQALDGERRLTTRLLFGLALVFVGVLAGLLFAGLPLEACVYAHGQYAENCASAAPRTLGQVALFGVGTLAFAGGAWLVIESTLALRAVRRDRCRTR